MQPSPIEDSLLLIQRASTRGKPWGEGRGGGERERDHSKDGNNSTRRPSAGRPAAHGWVSKKETQILRKLTVTGLWPRSTIRRRCTTDRF